VIVDVCCSYENDKTALERAFDESVHIYTCIHFSLYVDCTGGVYRSSWRAFYSVLAALKAMGTLSQNHSLNRRRSEQSLIKQEATKVSGQFLLSTILAHYTAAMITINDVAVDR